MHLSALLCVLVFVLGVAFASDATEWSFVTTNNNGKRVGVVIGLKRRSMLLIPDEDKTNKRCSTRTINQHDFDTGYVAMKDPVKRSCWLKPLGERETYEETKRIIDSGKEMMQTDENWIIPKRYLKKGQVKREVGSLLADFCSDSDVYMLKRDTLGRTRRSRSCTRNCGICAVAAKHQQ